MADDGAYRLDHVIVFVDDLAGVERSFAERLGLVATSHATHPGFGTRNARIIFASQHVELLTEADPAELRATRYGRLFLERHARRGNGPAVYVFRTDAFDEVIAACKTRGGLCEDRVVGQSRSGGVTRQWEAALMPGTEPVYLHPLLPTLGRGRARPAWTPGPHPIGATGLGGVVLATDDLDAATALYRVQLGLTPHHREDGPTARTAWYRLTQTGQRVILVEPRAGRTDGPVARDLARRGEGIFALILEVADLAAAVTALEQRGTAVSSVEWLAGLPITEPDPAAVTRLVLTAALDRLP